MWRFSFFLFNNEPILYKSNVKQDRNFNFLCEARVLKDTVQPVALQLYLLGDLCGSQLQLKPPFPTILTLYHIKNSSSSTLNHPWSANMQNKSRYRSPIMTCIYVYRESAGVLFSPRIYTNIKDKTMFL